MNRPIQGTVLTTAALIGVLLLGAAYLLANLFLSFSEGGFEADTSPENVMGGRYVE